MPDNSRQVSQNSQQYTLGDRKFVGINTNLPPNSLDVGFTQDITNMWVDGTSLAPRPGWQAQLTSTLGAPIYAMTKFRTADNQSNKILFVSGTTLYAHTVGLSTAPTSLGTGTWTDASQVRLIQHGKYIYGCPGKDGTAIFRTDGTNALEKIPQIKPPTTDGKTPVKPIATAVPNVIKTINAKAKIDSTYAAVRSKPVVTNFPTTWSDNLMKNSTGTGATIVPSGEFDGYYQGGSINNTSFTADWTVSGASVHTAEAWEGDKTKTITFPSGSPSWTGYTTKCYMKLDNTGEYAEQIVQGLPQEYYPPSSTPVTMGLYCLQFYSFANIIKSEGSVKFSVSVNGQDASGDVFGAVWSKEYQQAVPVNEAGWELRNVVIDFREFVNSSTPITKLRIRFTSTAAIAQQDILIDQVRVWAVASDFQVSTGNESDLDINGLVNIRFNQSNTNLGTMHSSYVKDKRIRIANTDDLGAALKLEEINSISFAWDFDQLLVTEAKGYPNVILGLQSGSSTTITWSSIGVWDYTNKFLTFNLFGLTKAQKTSISNLFVKFTTDVFRTDNSNAFDSRSKAYAIGSMTKDIGLGADQTYEYAFTLWYPDSATALAPYEKLADDTYSKGYETSLSAVSNTVTATAALSTTSVVLNPDSTSTKGTNVGRSKHPMTVVASADQSNQDFWVSTFVPGASQIRLVASTASPSITYIALDGSTVTVPSGSFSATSGADGTVYYAYTIPATNAGRIKYVTAVTGTIWLEHYVSYGYTDTSTYSHVLVYRRNSSIFPDGRFRLIAVIPYSESSSTATTVTGTGWTATYNNSTSREIVLNDIVPDSDLYYVTGDYKPGFFYQLGRDTLPLGASSLAVFQGRLWMSKGNLVAASWLLDPTYEYGIYTTEFPDFTEPSVIRKGMQFTVGGSQEKEIVRAMISQFSDEIQQSNTTSAALLILKENSLSAVTGFDPTTFTVQMWVATPGAGIAAPNTLSNTYGTVTWLSTNGVVAYEQGAIVPRSTELRKLLSLDPTMSGPANIDKSYYQQSLSTAANQRLFLVSTSSGASAANKTIYVFDARTRGWVKWTTPGSISFSSITTLTFSDDIQYVYAGSSDGQIYKLVGTADKTTAGGADIDIDWSLTTRQHGQTYSEGIAYYALNRPIQLDLHVQNVNAFKAATTTLEMNWAIQNQNGAYVAVTNPYGISSSGTWYFPQISNTTAAVRNIGRDVKGQALQIKLNGSSTGTFYLHGVHIHCYDANVPR